MKLQIWFCWVFFALFDKPMRTRWWGATIETFFGIPLTGQCDRNRKRKVSFFSSDCEAVNDDRFVSNKGEQHDRISWGISGNFFQINFTRSHQVFCSEHQPCILLLISHRCCYESLICMSQITNHSALEDFPLIYMRFNVKRLNQSFFFIRYFII